MIIRLVIHSLVGLGASPYVARASNVFSDSVKLSKMVLSAAPRSGILR